MKNLVTTSFGVLLVLLLLLGCDRRQETSRSQTAVEPKKTAKTEPTVKPPAGGTASTAPSPSAVPRVDEPTKTNIPTQPARPAAESIPAETTPESPHHVSKDTPPPTDPAPEVKVADDKPHTENIDKPDEPAESISTVPKRDNGSEKRPPRISGRKVARVLDGDTVLLDDDHELRYIGIDAPEIPRDDVPSDRGDPLWKEAMELNKKLVQGKELILEFDRVRRDSRGRLLAYVYVAGEKEGERVFVNAELIRAGLAWVYRHVPNNKYDNMLLKLQSEARKARKGIWKLPPPAKKEKMYISSHTTNRFHRPSCEYAKEISMDDREDYKTRDAAFDAGKSPCRECKP